MSVLDAKFKNRKSRNRRSNFNPSSEFIYHATAEYLSRGGTITKLEADEDAWRLALRIPSDRREADEFLNGGGDDYL